MTQWGGRLKMILPDAKLDEPLARYTTFKIGGPADAFVELGSVEELARLSAFARERALPVLWIGWGSNLLVLDGGVPGIVARLRGEFEKIEFLGGGRVRAGAAVRVPQLVTACAEKGLGGDEPLVGIPGTVGGALVMNAGTRDGEIGPLVREVVVFDEESGKPVSVPASRLRFEYRGSSLEGRLVLAGVLQLNDGDRVDIMRRVQAYQQRRLQTQPIHTFNVGSTFKNPPGLFVAKLIDELGLKGETCGGARISPMHGNFIENFNGAKASDVLELVRRARERVREAYGVELELEMKVVGRA